MTSMLLRYIQGLLLQLYHISRRRSVYCPVDSHRVLLYDTFFDRATDPRPQEAGPRMTRILASAIFPPRHPSPSRLLVSLFAVLAADPGFWSPRLWHADHPFHRETGPVFISSLPRSLG